jgi:hypothetical protein
MITQKLQRVRRAVWSWRQPLTYLPTLENAPISDLFVWRSSPEWQTFFELIDIPSLFEDDTLPRHVSLVFFDCGGRRLLERQMDLQANRRQTLDVSSMVGQSHGEMGTFAVFHSKTPSAITHLGSFLAERGYVSYCYLDAPLRAYVHGNLDAVALGPDGELQLLGGTSFLRRQYSLQHELIPGVVYELGLVNPTSSVQHITCKLISVLCGRIISVQTEKVSPGGIQTVVVPVDESGSVRLVIESHLVMARPLVFRIQNFKLDVFHG